ncbi:hypothetical protein [Actinosynnema sp.]|uniref:hypothetical protein n=1 Tax=Actinosynnema sp. TaxID=1872144 RepID=UPI003F862A50
MPIEVGTATASGNLRRHSARTRHSSPTSGSPTRNQPRSAPSGSRVPVISQNGAPATPTTATRHACCHPPGRAAPTR